MKIKNVICLSSVFAILLTGCTSELDEKSASQRQEIKLSSSIWGGTRAADLNEQDELILNGQQVGVTILGASAAHNNVAWISNGNSGLTTADPVYFLGTGNIDVVAYHPYNSAWTDVVNSWYTFNINSNQSQSLASSDLLWATRTDVPNTSSPVDLSFQHMLTKIKVKLTTDDTSLDLNQATIELNNVETNVNFCNGNLSAITGETGTILAGVNTAQAAAIIVPQTISSGTTLVTVTIQGKTYTFVPSTTRTLESGISYVYNLKVTSGGKLILMGATVNNWDENTSDENGNMNESGSGSGSSNYFVFESTSGRTLRYEGTVDSNNSVVNIEVFWIGANNNGIQYKTFTYDIADLTNGNFIFYTDFLGTLPQGTTSISINVEYNGATGGRTLTPGEDSDIFQ